MSFTQVRVVEADDNGDGTPATGTYTFVPRDASVTLATDWLCAQLLQNAA